MKKNKFVYDEKDKLIIRDNKGKIIKQDEVKAKVKKKGKK